MIVDRRTLLVATAGALVAGCDSTKIDLTDAPSFESLMRQIKYDVGTYIFRHQDDFKPVPLPPTTASPEEKAKYDALMEQRGFTDKPSDVKCAGQVAFTISKVKITTTTAVDTKNSASAGMKIPLNLVTVGPSLATTGTSNNTIATTLEIYPKQEKISAEPPPVPGWNGRPITETLEALRKNLIKTSDTKPCFNFGDSEEKKENTVKWGFTVTRSVSAGVKFELLIYSIGGEGSVTDSVANVIEVTFDAKGEAYTAPARTVR